MAQQIINTDRTTFEAYVKQGYWIPDGEVQWHKHFMGIVEADCLVKNRKGVSKKIHNFMKCTIIIAKYFPFDHNHPSLQ